MPKQLTSVESSAAAPHQVTAVESPPAIPDHELIRLIGQGSYGEVWLARNVMGTHRAVKVVYRDRFNEDEPFEREFDGIRRYEPVSRSDPGLMNILQIGRNEEERSFYYVMELADDAYAPGSHGEGDSALSSNAPTPEIDSANYIPKTLSRILADRIRLPVSECLSLGLALTQSLERLHGDGLLHRDVKPSNIIFVRGVPKLADIGLLAKVGEAQTLVGTEGFIAPEGPNSEQGDIFSLGKVLYEASTGKDRQQFPEPMTRVEFDPDSALLMELNAVIVTAAEHDPARRDASMGAIRADLELIDAGKSVRQKRLHQKRWRRLKCVMAWGLLVIGLITLSAYLIHWRNQALSAPVLTQLAIPTQHFDFIEERDAQYDFSPDGTGMILAHDGSLYVWEKATGVERPLNGKLPRWRLRTPRYSPDGSTIACLASKSQHVSKEEQGTQRVLFLRADGAVAQPPSAPIDFHLARPFWRPDGSGIIFHSDRGAVEINRRGEVIMRPEWPLTDYVSRSSFSPNGRWIATGKTREDAVEQFDTDLWILPVDGGPAVQITERRGIDAHPVWDKEGDALYYISSEGSHNHTAWNLRKIGISKRTGSPKRKSRPITHFEEAYALFPQFIRGGTQLIFAAKTGANLLWVVDESETGAVPRPVVRGEHGFLSPDGEHVIYANRTPSQSGIFRVPIRGGDPKPIINEHDYPWERFAFAPSFDLSPDGQFIIFAGGHGPNRAIFKAPVSGQEAPIALTSIPEEASVLPVWSPNGKHLAYVIDGQMFVMDSDGSHQRLLATIHRWQAQSLQWSPDSTQVAAFGYESPEIRKEELTAFVVAADGSGMRRITPANESEYKEGLSWHPDGERLTYMRYGPGKFGAEIRWAFADGRPTELFIDVPERWDWIGSWAPDGERFFFQSSGRDTQRQYLHDLSSGKTEPYPQELGIWIDWSQDGHTRLWNTQRQEKQIWMIEGFR